MILLHFTRCSILRFAFKLVACDLHSSLWRAVSKRTVYVSKRTFGVSIKSTLFCASNGIFGFYTVNIAYRTVASSIIGGGGADIHIFVFCTINFF